jgi:asparagine synthase (glutamine-hydrolysing)
MCNGEVYNYVELKQALKNEGVNFRTASDTEVVLKMYEKYGIEMVKFLEGMYAISIIDKLQNKIYLIRDRFGIKPLYYTKSKNGEYAFASEIKPLLRLPFVSKSIRKKSVADFLKYEYIHAPYTIFEDVKKVLPGHYLVISDGEMDDIEYWDCADIEEKETTVEECKEKVTNLLKESLSLHLRSDVKLGLFLSGGIDSGLITALASEQVKNLDTYTLRFENAGYDESKLAEMVARKCGTNHHCYTVKMDDFKRLIAEMTWYFDEPLGDSGILPNYILNRLVNQNETKVILSGAGGDELFAGYPYYCGSNKEKIIAQFPKVARIISRLIKGGKPELAWRLYRSSFLRENPILHMTIHKQTFLTSDLTRILGMDADDVNFEYSQRSRGNNLNKMLYTDIKTYLADDLLLLSDRSCMAFSVEGRVPFLYRPLVEYALSIPEKIKAPNGQRKWLLIDIAKQYLPQEVINAPKVGFCSPIDKWRDAGLDDFAYEILNDEKSINRDVWNTDEYKKYVSEKRNYKYNFRKIYLLLILEIYFRIHLDNSYDSVEEIDILN